jgi:hypothetical protein
VKVEILQTALLAVMVVQVLLLFVIRWSKGEKICHIGQK